MSLLRLLARSKPLWGHSENIVVAMLFAAQVSQLEPMCYWASSFLETDPHMHTSASIEDAWMRLASTWRGIKRRSDGTYGTAGTGMLGCRAERSDGETRYLALAAALPEVWRFAEAVCLEVSRKTTTVRGMLTALEVLAPVYDGKVSYGNLRCLRLIVCGLGCTWADSEDCWSIWRRMSAGMPAKCRQLHIYDYDQALLIRNMLRRRQHDYSLADLICYACLSEG